MKESDSTKVWTIGLLALIGLFTAFYLWGVEAVPFHPDESTYLYMSSDLETLFKAPTSMIWQPENEGDRRQHYRVIDAPLTRYLLGGGRILAGQPALAADWDWGKSWAENQEAGALPENALLKTGRVTVILVLPVSLLLIFLIGRAISGRYTGLLAVILLGLNALALLHNRRAMAESTLTVAILFAIWSFTQAERRPWLAGLAMALAFNAKHSALALLPVGLLAACWIPRSMDNRLHRSIRGGAAFLLIFGLVTFALNPYLWRDPLEALQATWSARQDLLASQLSHTARLAPTQILVTPMERAAALLANVYYTPLSFSEVGNYIENTAPSEQVYRAMPLHTLFRGLVGGTLLLVLTITGMLHGALMVRRPNQDRQRALVITLLATVMQITALVITIPLPWQRYSIPLLPFASLWAAYAIGYWLDARKERIGNVSAPISQRA
jgi:hypothetical protein